MRIGIPIYDNFDALDVIGAYQVFKVSGMQPILLAQSMCAVRSWEDVQMIPHYSFDNTDSLDVLFVPGGTHLGDVLGLLGPDQNPLLAFIRRMAKGNKRCKPKLITSVCTGALFLAAAGQLDGYHATTHWNYKPVLALFPKVKVLPGFPRWHQDRNRITGGGISSTIDEALFITSRLLGASAAKCAQLTIQYAPGPPFRDGDPLEASPRILKQVRADMEDPATTAAFQAWIAKWGGSI